MFPPFNLNAKFLNKISPLLESWIFKALSPVYEWKNDNDYNKCDKSKEISIYVLFKVDLFLRFELGKVLRFRAITVNY